MAGSSMLEGYHLHLRLCLHVLGRAASVDRLDALTNTHDLVWSAKSLRKAGRIDTGVKHFDFALLDKLFDVAKRLQIQDQVAGLKLHRRTVREPPRIRFGAHYGLQVAERLVTAATAPAAQAHDTWTFEQALGDLTARGRSLHYTPDESDIQLMQANALLKPEALQRRLLENGLCMLKSSPDKFLETLLAREKGFQVLRDNDAPQLRAQLRLPLQGMNMIYDRGGPKPTLPLTL